MTQAAPSAPSKPIFRKSWIGLAAVILCLAGIAVYQWGQVRPLSPAEQALVGEWKESFVKYHPAPPPGSPNTWTRFWTFQTDRTFTMGDSLAQPRYRGHWKVEKNQFILDFYQPNASRFPLPRSMVSRTEVEFIEKSPGNYLWKDYYVPGKVWHECLLTPFDELVDSRTGTPTAGSSP